MLTTKAEKKHPDQTDELMLARGIPCDVLPRENHAAKKQRDADVDLAKAQLRAVGAEMRDAQNAMVAEWLGFHYVAGSAAMLAVRQPVEAVPTALFLAMYHAAKPCLSQATTEVLTCALNWLVATIKAQRSPRSTLRRWQAVLVRRNAERPWFWGERQPIRLSPKSAAFEAVGGDIHCVVRVVKGSPPIRLKLKGEVATDRKLRPDGPGRNGAKYNARLAALREAMSVRGALLTESRGSWELTFLERRAAPILPVRDDLRTMFVRPSNEAGWRVRWHGRKAFLVGGEALADLANVRREQIARRSELRARGIDSRTAAAQGMKDRWTNYCRTLYQQTANEICAWCEAHGIERIALMSGDDWCALGSVGNDDLEKSEPTRFPFAAFAGQVKQNAMRRGIVVVSRANFRSVKRRKERWLRKLAMDQLQAVAK